MMHSPLNHLEGQMLAEVFDEQRRVQAQTQFGPSESQTPRAHCTCRWICSINEYMPSLL